MDGKIAIFHGKSTRKNKDGFWVAILTRKVLNNGRTYSCGYVFLWDLMGMLAISKALEARRRV